MTSQELAVVMEKLAKIEQKQDECQSNFLNSLGANENPDASAFVSSTSSGRGKKIASKLSQLITLVKATKDWLNKLNRKKKKMDDFEQYVRSNCIILHGCVNLSNENAGYVTFENFVLGTLNSRPIFPHSPRNSDIDICHAMPSRKIKSSNHQIC